MKFILFAICIIYLLLRYRASHFYKSQCVKHTSEVGFALGTILSALIDGFVWYGILKLTDLL